MPLVLTSHVGGRQGGGRHGVDHDSASGAAVLMSVSTIVAALNSMLLRRLDLGHD